MRRKNKKKNKIGFLIGLFLLSQGAIIMGTIGIIGWEHWLLDAINLGYVIIGSMLHALVVNELINYKGEGRR